MVGGSSRGSQKHEISIKIMHGEANSAVWGGEAASRYTVTQSSCRYVERPTVG